MVSGACGTCWKAMKGYHHRHRNGSHKRSKTDSSKIGLVSAFWGISTGNMLFVLHWKCQIASSTVHICIVVFFWKSRQQEQDTLPPANSGWEYQAPTGIQTWFNLFFLCRSSVFRCIFKGLELPLERERESERETEKQSLVEFRFGSRKTQTKNLECTTISKSLWHLHFQQWRWTWNLPCFSLHFCPLTSLAGLLNPPWSLQTARWSCEDHPEHPVPYSWKKTEGWLGRSHQPVFPKGGSFGGSLLNDFKTSDKMIA